MSVDKYIIHRIILNVCTGIAYVMLGVCLELNLNKEPDNPDFKVMNKLKYRFTTIWNLVCEVSYIILALYVDIQDLRKKYVSTKLRDRRCKLFNDLIFPLAMTTGINFWVVFLIDKDNIVPIKSSEFQKIFTEVMIHISHTYIVVYVIWELIYHPRQCCKKENSGLLLMLVYGTAYGSILVYTYFDMNIWIYVILTKYAGTVYFYLCLVQSFILAYGAHKLQWWIKDRVWQMRDAWAVKEQTD